MYTLSTDGQSYINSIINQKGDSMLFRNLVQLARNVNKIASIARLVPVLDNCDPCLVDYNMFL